MHVDGCPWGCKRELTGKRGQIWSANGGFAGFNAANAFLRNEDGSWTATLRSWPRISSPTISSCDLPSLTFHPTTWKSFSWMLVAVPTTDNITWPQTHSEVDRGCQEAHRWKATPGRVHPGITSIPSLIQSWKWSGSRRDRDLAPVFFSTYVTLYRISMLVVQNFAPD